MEINLSKELKHTFELATLRNKTKGLRTPNDWEKGNNIIKRYKNETHKQTQAYYAGYDIRVNKLVQRLIDKAGGKNRDFKHRWFGTDPFDKERLTNQAHRVVQHDHHRRLARLEESEALDLGKLIETIEQRDQLREKPRRDFEKVADRRDTKNAPEQQPRHRRR